MHFNEQGGRKYYESLISETSLQLAICNACRYCEGYCPVWDVIEYRKEFGKSDVEYIGNLCHDCGQCFDVCPFVPPHEFAVDIPKALSEVRSRTYEEYAVPRIASGLFNSQAKMIGVLALISFILVSIAFSLSGNPQRLFTSVSSPGSFYVIIPNAALDAAGLILAFFAVLSWSMSGTKFMRDTNRFGKISFADLFNALKEGLGGKWLKGGGAGCNYPRREEHGSSTKVIVHSMVLYGFLLDLISTISAFLEQDLFGIIPPFPIFSIPVIAGLAGGILIVAGVLSFFYLDSIEAGPKKSEMKILDKAFLTSLLLTALTGILLLSLRNTQFMGILLLIHLTVVSTLFLTAPYGKFVHFVYRYLSIARYHQEKREFEESRAAN